MGPGFPKPAELLARFTSNNWIRFWFGFILFPKSKWLIICWPIVSKRHQNFQNIFYLQGNGQALKMFNASAKVKYNPPWVLTSDTNDIVLKTKHQYYEKMPPPGRLSSAILHHPGNFDSSLEVRLRTPGTFDLIIHLIFIYDSSSDFTLVSK